MKSAPTLVRIASFECQGYRLGYELYGEAGPLCILIHGILLDANVNRDLALRFVGAGYRVALLDLLGHGRSDRSRDPKDHRTDFYADQVLGLLDHLGEPRALVGGVSLGAITALQFAARHPQRLFGLFLEMPVLEWSMPWAAVILSPAVVAARYLRPLYRRFAGLVGGLPRPRTAWMASVMNAASLEPEVAAAILHGVLVGPVAPTEAQRRQMRMPALIIGHGRDKLHEYRDAEALARQMPNARLLRARSILEMRSHPERLWPEIARFLKELQAGIQDSGEAAQAQPRSASRG